MKPEFITDLDWQLLKEKYKDNLEKVIDKLERHYPVQYLIGYVDFYDTHINVDERVLIPRFETEYLVEKTIQRIKSIKQENPKILELGTGSGCISIALKKHFSCEVTAVDISEDALDVAKENAKLNHVDIHFILEDMLKTSYEHFDIIISNPPYVSQEIHVGEETKYEPQTAIFASDNGLIFYENIIKKSVNHLLPNGFLAFEIGCNQANDITKIAYKYYPNAIIKVEKDLTNRNRYLFIFLTGE